MARLFCVFLCLLCASSSALAAEIININYKYKIAFTDMTENEVKAGDSVLVVLPDGKNARLKVLETYPVMAKLTFADGDGAVTADQFASIVVGARVTLADQARHAARAVAARKVKAAEEAVEAPKAEIPAGIETYSPGAARPEAAGARLAERPAVESSRGVVVDELSSDRGRMAVLEQRLDQMMNNNVRLAENITQLLADKAAAEALARSKEADTLSARKKANELADANAVLSSTINALQQEKSALQKEVESLNVRLGELKKKLAKMVDIINTNMKAYEKQ